MRTFEGTGGLGFGTDIGPPLPSARAHGGGALEGSAASAAVGGSPVRCFTFLGGDLVSSGSVRFGVAPSALRMANMASTLGLGAVEGDFAHLGFEELGGHLTGMSNSK